ncbi:hypothetical protein ACHAQA_008148 [Verticillium albo-atrum]
MDSPTKRRALAPLDANASSPSAAFSLKPQPSAPARSPLKASLGLFSTSTNASLKRPLHDVVARGDDNENVAAKKLCQEPAPRPARRSLPSSPRRESSIEVRGRTVVLTEAGTAENQQTTMTTQQHSQEVRTRSASPAVSSVFDASIASGVNDDTAMTDPELAQQAVAALGPRRPAPMTREQAREKAQILRLRLGLANYKLRTGQVDVPLERLQRRPVPAPKVEPPARQGSVDSDATVEAEVGERDVEVEAGAEAKQAETTPAEPTPTMQDTNVDAKEGETPVAGASLGGAATGLLSLARTALPLSN